MGIKINLLTRDDLEEFKKTSDVTIPDNARAFFYNGEIYINLFNAKTSDFFHEYSHLFLAVLKAKNPNMYQAMMDKIWQSSDPNFEYRESWMVGLRKTVERNYENLA
jgi:hypothetical protein